MPTLAELVAAISAEGAEVTIKKIDDVGKSGEKTGNKLDKMGSKATQAFVGMAKRVGLTVAAYLTLSRAVDELTESTHAAARLETLDVVLHAMGKNAGYTQSEVDKATLAVKNMGITSDVARQTVVSFLQAQLDLSKAAKLARASQDLAVIGGINSSEALERVLHGIITMQPEVLRMIGLNVSFENELSKAAAASGKMTTAIGQQERQQIALNAVLREAAKASGVYEGAMETAGKQAGSLEREIQTLHEQIGKHFTGIYAEYIKLQRKLTQAGIEFFTTDSIRTVDEFKAEIESLQAHIADLRQQQQRGIFDVNDDVYNNRVKELNLQILTASNRIAELRVLINNGLRDVDTFEGKSAQLLDNRNARLTAQLQQREPTGFFDDMLQNAKDTGNMMVYLWKKDIELVGSVASGIGNALGPINQFYKDLKSGFENNVKIPFETSVRNMYTNVTGEVVAGTAEVEVAQQSSIDSWNGFFDDMKSQLKKGSDNLDPDMKAVFDELISSLEDGNNELGAIFTGFEVPDASFLENLAKGWQEELKNIRGDFTDPENAKAIETLRNEIERQLKETYKVFSPDEMIKARKKFMDTLKGVVQGLYSFHQLSEEQVRRLELLFNQRFGKLFDQSIEAAQQWYNGNTGIFTNIFTLPSKPQDQEQQKLRKQAKTMIEAYKEQAALAGRSSEAAKIYYKLEHGRMKALYGDLREQLKLEAARVDYAKGQVVIKGLERQLEITKKIGEQTRIVASELYATKGVDFAHIGDIENKRQLVAVLEQQADAFKRLAIEEKKAAAVEKGRMAGMSQAQIDRQVQLIEYQGKEKQSQDDLNKALQYKARLLSTLIGPEMAYLQMEAQLQFVMEHKLIDDHQQYLAILKKITQEKQKLYEATNAVTIGLGKELDALNLNEREQFIKRYTDQLNKYADNYDDMLASARDLAGELYDQAKRFRDIDSLAGDLASSVTDTFQNMNGNVVDSFREMVDNIQKILQDMVYQRLVTDPLKEYFKSVLDDLVPSYAGGGLNTGGINLGNLGSMLMSAVSSFFGGSFASGGEFTVPGAASSTDNKIVQFLGAGGEKVKVTPSRAAGGESQSSQTVKKIYVNNQWNISTPNPQAFARSRDQIMRQAGRQFNEALKRE